MIRERNERNALVFGSLVVVPRLADRRGFGVRVGDYGVYLLEADGSAVEGRELSEAEIEQVSRETLLADVLELAAAKLRSGKAGMTAQPRMCSTRSSTR